MPIRSGQRFRRWPITFSGLTGDDAQNLLRFIKAYLGQQIKLLDWEGRLSVGVITKPDDPIVQDGKEMFSASFEFEGELVPHLTEKTMFEISAPYPMLQTTSVLPNPQFSDPERIGGDRQS